MSPQTLLIDADDTLWENNIYFERAIARFISFLNHHEFSPEQVREVLNDVERECIVTHGYGLHSFAHALIDTFERLSLNPVTPEMHEQIQSFAHTIADHPIELLPEVLRLCNIFSPPSPDPDDQGRDRRATGKIERSGLKEYFAAIEIVAEKDAAAYAGSSRNTSSTTTQPGWSATARSLTSIPRWPPDCTPFSCRTATLGYSSMKKSTGSPAQKLLIVGSFAELREHF